MMYLTHGQAAERLKARYGIEATLNIGDVALACDDLDQLAPFKVDVDIDDLPDALLDWVALKAHIIAEDEPGAVVEDSMSPFTTRYAKPEKTRNGKRLDKLIAPYLKHTGRVA